MNRNFINIFLLSTNDKKLGIIFADSINEAGMNGIPERFADARMVCITNSHDLTKLCEVLHPAAARQRRRREVTLQELRTPAVVKPWWTTSDSAFEFCIAQMHAEKIGSSTSGSGTSRCSSYGGYQKGAEAHHTSSKCLLRIKGKSSVKQTKDNIKKTSCQKTKKHDFEQKFKDESKQKFRDKSKDRLDPAVTACVVCNQDFAEACRVIWEFDERQHAAGFPDAHSTKGIKRVQKNPKSRRENQNQKIQAASHMIRRLRQGSFSKSSDTIGETCQIIQMS